MKAIVEYQIDDSFADGFLGGINLAQDTDLVNTIVLGGLDEIAAPITYSILEVTR